jgi:integrase
MPRFLVRWRARNASGTSILISKMVYGDAEAHAFLAEKLKSPNRAAKMVEKTFQEYVDNEWARYTARKWKASTVVTMGCGVRKHILPYFGPMALSGIKAADVEAFHAELERKKLAPATRRNLHSILAKMFAYAIDDLELLGEEKKSPVKRALAPQVKQKKKPTLSAQELERLLRSVDIRYRAFFTTLALTGVRSSEALGLKWQDVDFVDRMIHVRCAISRGCEATPKTEGSVRDRPMPPRLYESLLHHRAMSAYITPDSYVFSSSSGRPANPDQLREHLQATLKSIGIKFTQERSDGLHLLRHSGASILYQNTTNVKATQEFLGHSTSKITLDTYTHVSPDQAQRSGLALEQAIFAQPSVSPEPTN